MEKQFDAIKKKNIRKNKKKSFQKKFVNFIKQIKIQNMMQYMSLIDLIMKL